MNYLFIVVVTLILGLGSQAAISHAYKKWGKVHAACGLTGAQAARKMLDANGLQHVGINHIGGELTDHFDPKSNTLNLSQSTYDQTSVAAIAIACHEAGHAIQHATGYKPIQIRAAIVPAAQFASNAWIFILVIGMLMHMLSLVWVAVALYACVVVFQIATLPVEFNASARALDTIRATLPLPEEQDAGCAKVLRAAAFTYVAAALASLLQLLYYLGMARGE